MLEPSTPIFLYRSQKPIFTRLDRVKPLYSPAQPSTPSFIEEPQIFIDRELHKSLYYFQYLLTNPWRASSEGSLFATSTDGSNCEGPS